MSDKMQVNSATPAAYGFGGAVVGGIAGIAAAPRLYNLEQLLTLPPDTFAKEFPTKVLAKASKDQHSAMENLRNARKTIMEAAKKNVGDAKLAEFKSSKNLSKDYSVIKDLVPKARTQSAFIGAIVIGIIAALGRIIFSQQQHT